MRRSIPLSCLAVFSLLGCGQSESLSPPPANAELVRIATEAHINTYGRSPVNLAIGEISKSRVFADRDDYIVCVSTTEKQLGDRFDAGGNLLTPEGTSFRQSTAMLIREYSYGWGSGIYRRVESGRIGQARASDFCPQSEV